jgi:hypothetical protein
MFCHERETKTGSTGTASSGRSASETFKDLHPFTLCDSWTRIFNRYPRFFVGAIFDHYSGDTATVQTSVLEEVGHDPFKSTFVDLENTV